MTLPSFHSYHDYNQETLEVEFSIGKAFLKANIQRGISRKLIEDNRPSSWGGTTNYQVNECLDELFKAYILLKGTSDILQPF